ncbi:MAG: hypothetical protein KatS3mg122_3314 [Caldimonas sp.]|nr:MAG: hypothetical protein KatS3mg122_3314 [Caldimonas sp.]
MVPAQQGFLQRWHDRGVKLWFVVYDLLPILFPQGFPEGAPQGHRRWFEAIGRFDGLACISRAVADEVAAQLAQSRPGRERALPIGWFHLGADVVHSQPSFGLPADAQQVLKALQRRPTFLMVGTLEPRKGHAQTLEAFEQIWAQGSDANLAIVGKQGWMVEALVDRLRGHPEHGKRLFWLEGISDEYLEKVYAASTCLIAASYGEGFGLPLIEAAQHRLPIIARDIPVFREVAGEHAFFFANDKDPTVIAKAVRAWLDLHRAGRAPSSQAMPWLTWEQSARHLLDIVLERVQPYRTWLPEKAIPSASRQAAPETKSAPGASSARPRSGKRKSQKKASH